MAANATIVEIEKQMFTPALQQAMQQAQDAGHGFTESIMGATNAHLNMLVELVGIDEARVMLKNQLQFLDAQKPKKAGKRRVAGI